MMIMGENGRPLFHVTTTEQWESVEGQLYYVPGAFQKEGFVHCCRRGQLSGVLDRYFKGQEGLLILKLNEEMLGDLVRYESPGNNELFPHVYGPIPKSAILGIEIIENR
jgi:uncharacterized protein (DUF952 family)